VRAGTGVGRPSFPPTSDSTPSKTVSSCTARTRCSFRSSVTNSTSATAKDVSISGADTGSLLPDRSYLTDTGGLRRTRWLHVAATVRTCGWPASQNSGQPSREGECRSPPKGPRLLACSARSRLCAWAAPRDRAVSRVAVQCGRDAGERRSRVLPAKNRVSERRSCTTTSHQARRAFVLASSPSVVICCTITSVASLAYLLTSLN
jgi:hypothetical protein